MIAGRRAVQSIALVCFAALVLIPPGVPTGGAVLHPYFFMDPYLALISLCGGGALAWSMGLGGLALLVLTLRKGAFFCRSLCPLGAVQDFLPSMNVRLEAPTRADGPDRARRRRFRFRSWLLVAVIIAAAFGLLPAYLLDPMSLLAQGTIATFDAAGPGGATAGAALAIVALFAVLAASMVSRRVYCRHLCPLGECFVVAQGWTYRFARERARRLPAPPAAQPAREPMAASPLLTRRGFLGVAAAIPVGAAVRGDPKPLPIRPPGALPESEFARTCVRCGQCFTACPTGAVVPSMLEGGIGGFLSPRLDFRRGPCVPGCIACQQSCPSGALRILPPLERRTVRIGLAKIDGKRCVRSGGVDCRVCKSACPYNALTYPTSGPSKLPYLEADLCIGCGMCEHACPSPGGVVIETEGLA